jgi:hypothetical protein
MYESPNAEVVLKLTFFCTEFKTVSSGIVTNFSTSSALRPGHCEIIIICVLVTSGNVSIGVCLKLYIPIAAITPVRKNTR